MFVECLHTHRIVWLSGLLGIVCVTGDQMVEATGHLRILASLCDNATHAIVSAICALIVVLEFSNRLAAVEQRLLVACAFVTAACIDVDHFIEAHSINLELATRLNHRPFMHCSNIAFAVFIAFIVCANVRSFRLNVWLAVLFGSIASHHIRDATRRGFWIRPFGHTAAIPYVLYVVLTMLLPGCLVGMLRVFRDKWSVVKVAYRQEVWLA